MASFSWRKRPSTHFGDVWVSIVQIEVAGTRGRFLPLRVQLDTGAVVSLFQRGVATKLGLDFGAGRRVSFGGFLGTELTARAYEVRLRVDWRGAVGIPVAFAERDDIPNLLGWLGVYEHFEIVIDPTARQTRINGPLA